VLLSTLGFASFGVWAKLVGDTYEVFTQAWTRALIICVVLVVVGLLTKQLKRFDKKDLKWVYVYTAFSLFTVAPIYYAFTQMDIGTATILFYAAYMVASYVIGRLFLGEKITVPKVIAMALAVVGMGLVFGVELAGVSVLAMGLAILNGIASGGEVSFTKKVSQTYSPLQLTLVSWVAICVVHFIIAVAMGENLMPAQTAQSSIGIVLFALSAMAAFWLVVAGYKRIEAGIGGLIGTLEVPFAVLLGAVFFSEQLAVPAIIGGLLIFIAAALPDGVEMIRARSARKAKI
jgi:drug/metabolite transporter (DMT)-like permease